MTPERAKDLAQTSLVWLAGQPEALSAFLNTSGTAVSDLRTRVEDPEFLGALLDFLLGSDALVLAFAADLQLPPELPARARAALPGGDAPTWT